MGTIAITGAGGGIGRACRARLEQAGHQVVGIDARDADVVGDLTTSGGRRAVLARLDDHCGGELDGLVVVPPPHGADAPTAVSVGFFGAVAAIEGVRPMLVDAEDAGVVVVGSNAATTRAFPLEIAEWCLAGDEVRARQVAGHDEAGARAAAELATALWVRRNAAGYLASGIRMNVVAPGPVDAELPEGAWDAVRQLGEAYPTPQGRPARAEEVAATVAFLLSADGAHFCGTVLTMDGGAEAALRPDAWPRPPGH